MEKPLFSARGGVSSEYPENTLTSLLGAIYQGYDYVEIDLAVTKDGRLVLFGGDKISRTGRKPDGSVIAGKIKISDLTLGELSEYDFGLYFSNKFRGESVPILSDALELAGACSMTLKLNGLDALGEDTLSELFETVRDSGARVSFTCSNTVLARKIAENIPSAELHYEGEVTEDILSELASLSDTVPTVWLRCDGGDLDRETVSLIKKYARLGISDVNTPSELNRALKYAPDTVETRGNVKPRKNIGIIADMHTHSLHSHDSECPIPEMAEAEKERGITFFAVTDHCDVGLKDKINVPLGIRNSVNDATRTNEELNGITVLRGVEISEGFWHPEVEERVIFENEYDAIIGSVHDVKYRDFSDSYARCDFAPLTGEQLVEFFDMYLDDMVTLIEKSNFDILAHLTCPLRYIVGKYGFEFDTRIFKNKIEKILRMIISRGIALEINSSGIGTAYDRLMPDRWIIELYRDLGGYLVTLGSDAHISKNASRGFDVSLKTLKELGFENIYYLKNRFFVQCGI